MSGTTSTARPVRPSRAAGQDVWLPWLIVAAAVLVVLATTAVWLAGGVAHRLATGSWPQVGWSPTLLPAAAGVGGWPWDQAVSPRAVRVAAAMLLAGVLVPSGIVVTRWWARGWTGLGSLRCTPRPGSPRSICCSWSP